MQKTCEEKELMELLNKVKDQGLIRDVVHEEAESMIKAVFENQGNLLQNQDIKNFQTRDSNGEIRLFSTLKEAYDYASKNNNVWKISYNFESENDNHRWVKKVSKPSGKVLWLDSPFRSRERVMIAECIEVLTDEDFCLKCQNYK